MLCFPPARLARGRHDVSLTSLYRNALVLTLIAACSGGETKGPLGDPPFGFEDEEPECVATADGDTLARTFRIEALDVPETDSVGFNIDGIVSTSTDDLAGCRRIDGAPGGIDNALPIVLRVANVALASSAYPAFELDLQQALADGGTAMTFSIEHWNGTPDDGCLTATLTASSPIRQVSVSRTTALVNGLIERVKFEDGLPLSPVFAVETEGDTEWAVVPLLLQAPRVRLRFDSLMSRIESSAENPNASSLLGGLVRYRGEVGDISQPLERSLPAVLDRVVPLASMRILDEIRRFPDLDGSPGPALSVCTSIGGLGVSADSFSIGLRVSGTAEP